ncbi:hypothetical protein E4U24_002495 [Claviceps purpurea]|nr:hypothetical protein E4U24_002495 [Claviceps purpurea]KAG6314658.1 hypothetical protein E4U44_001735 [Claviceps purpurea]
MDRSAPEYSQSGLPSPYSSSFGDNHSEGSTADPASAAQYPVKTEVSYPTTATPTPEYGVYPPSARPGAYSGHIQRSYNPASSNSGAGMAQQPNDPSIGQHSPTYPYPPPQPSPYAPNQDMTHGYSHPSGAMYAQPRPDWGGYGHHGAPPMAGGHPGVYGHNQASQAQQRSSQVYSFVPIPGAQQHKRPRRRYEEIERMYKCGWNGCEKAYGTLNHLNAHVTMQSHGQKRTPEEFKEIRKEWKQRKKEEEAQRKAEEESQASAGAGSAPPDQGLEGPSTPSYPVSRAVQLPPIGYQPAQYPAPSGGVPQQGGLADYGAGHMYPNYPPHSPYGQPNQNMYSQCEFSKFSLAEKSSTKMEANSFAPKSASSGQPPSH